MDTKTLYYNSAIRQFGNSAIRQFGNSAIRQFGNSLNRSLTLAFLLALPLSAALTVTARAEWSNTTTLYPIYSDTNNWTGGLRDDNIIGTVGSQAVTFSDVLFDAGATTIYTGTFNAKQLYVGQAITGSGLAEGTVITAINNAGQITISAPTEAASSGPLTVNTIGALNGYAALGVNTDVTYTEGSLVFGVSAGFDLSSIKVGQRFVNTSNGTRIDNSVTAIDTEARTFTVGGAVLPISSGNGTGSFVQLNWTFNVASGGAAGPDDQTTFTGNFIYANAMTPFTTVFTPTNAGIPTWNFTSKNPVFMIDTNGTGTNSNSGNVNVTLGANSRNLVIKFAGADTVVTFDVDPLTNGGSNLGQTGKVDVFYIDATGSNLGGINKTGAGTLQLAGKGDQVWTLAGGPVTISGGVLHLLTEGQNLGVNLKTPRLSGASRIDVANRGSTLYLDAGSIGAGSTVTQNLLDSAPINLYSAGLAARGGPNNATLTPLSSQAVGDVTLMGGRNVIGLGSSRDGGSGLFTLTLNSLTRENYATANVFGGKLGDNTSLASSAGQIKVTNDDNILGDLVGGGGAAGGKTVSIIPWLTVTGSGMANDYNNGWLSGDPYQYGGIDLATYTSGSGFRALTPGEYDNTFADAATTGVHSNVWLTANTTLGTAQTINALKLGNVTLTVNDTLTVTSGVIIGLNAVAKVINGSGAINSGAAPIYFYGDNITTVNAALTNTVSEGPGLILAQTGTTILTGSNTYGGWTLVQGNAQVNTANAVTNSELRVDRSGALTVGGLNTKVQITKLSGNGTVNFSDAGSQLNIGGTTGAEHTVTVNAGGVVAPGDTNGQYQTGTLLLGTNVEELKFLAGSFLDLDVLSDTVSDQIAATSPYTALTFADGANLRVNLRGGYTPDAGAELDWLLFTGFGDITLGEVNVLDAQGDPLDGFDLSLRGNNLFLTAIIPEPGTWTLLLTGAALLALLRRRR